MMNLKYCKVCSHEPFITDWGDCSCGCHQIFMDIAKLSGGVERAKEEVMESDRKIKQMDPVIMELMLRISYKVKTPDDLDKLELWEKVALEMVVRWMNNK